MLYVILAREDGQAVVTLGPFKEEETDKVFAAMEHIKEVYRPGTYIPERGIQSIKVLRQAFSQTCNEQKVLR